MTPISICIIAKNEEKNMEKFLYSIKKHMGKYPYEIVIVDTGSTDRTVSIAQKYTTKIFHFDWIDDFSAARNFSISCATYDWILVLDCDEFITDLNPLAFQEMIKKYPDSVGLITRKNYYRLNGSDRLLTDLVERFFHRDLYHYECIIHEQLRAFDGHIYTRYDLSLTTDHGGYNSSREDLEKKVKRNNDLLFKMLEENPNNPYVLFQIGQSYNMLDDDENACHYYGKGLEYVADPRLEYVQMMVVQYGYCLLHLQRYEEALLLENIYDEFGNTADFVCLMGLIYLRTGNYIKAMQEFLKATDFDTARVEGANTFIPTHNLASINEVLGNTETAIALYKKCGNFQPSLERLKALTEQKNS